MWVSTELAILRLTYTFQRGKTYIISQFSSHLFTSLIIEYFEYAFPMFIMLISMLPYSNGNKLTIIQTIIDFCNLLLACILFFFLLFLSKSKERDISIYRTIMTYKLQSGQISSAVCIYSFPLSSFLFFFFWYKLSSFL